MTSVAVFSRFIHLLSIDYITLLMCPSAIPQHPPNYFFSIFLLLFIYFFYDREKSAIKKTEKPIAFPVGVRRIQTGASPGGILRPNLPRKASRPREPAARKVIFTRPLSARSEPQVVLVAEYDGSEVFSFSSVDGRNVKHRRETLSGLRHKRVQ